MLIHSYLSRHNGYRTVTIFTGLIVNFPTWMKKQYDLILYDADIKLHWSISWLSIIRFMSFGICAMVSGIVAKETSHHSYRIDIFLSVSIMIANKKNAAKLERIIILYIICMQDVSFLYPENGLHSLILMWKSFALLSHCILSLRLYTFIHWY